MQHIILIGSFLFFTIFVAFLTWIITHNEDTKTNEGFFLAGRSLTFPVIAGSLLLTNLSTEQVVGLNGDAFISGLSVMAWEIIAVIALVIMALFFLPRFLKSGITTIPQLMEIRFSQTTQTICNFIFLVAYATILLPTILYTGASGLAGILDLKNLTGIQNDTILLWASIWLVALIGAGYALFGGLRSVAVSDTLNGIGLLAGGLLITYFGLCMISGTGNPISGLETLRQAVPEQFNSIGEKNAPVPFGTIFTGVLIINIFYWCTNQQIIQRTLAAKNLIEGQKGVLLTGILKLLGPLYLVLPGIMARYLFVVKGNNATLRPVDAYGALVRSVLPSHLTGFFAAVMVGAILSSFNSALNSTCTLFSLGIYKRLAQKEATDEETIRSGKYFGIVLTFISMLVAPLLAGQESIFTYLQTMNGLYSVPICAVVLAGFLSKKTPSVAANIALIGGILFIAFGYFCCPSLIAFCGGYYHFLGIVFIVLILFMIIIGKIFPRQIPWTHEDSGEVDLTPWKYAVPMGIVLIIFVFLIYFAFADFSILS